MSIPAFYRTWVPVVPRYTYNFEGDTVEVFGPTVYYKGNIQPWKSGLNLDITQVGIVFSDFLRFYSKQKVTFERPVGVPDSAALVWWFWFKGRWYNTQGEQDWSVAGRAPKHFQYLGKFNSGDQPAVGEPTPFPELVDAFALIVSELHQLTPLVIQAIN